MTFKELRDLLNSVNDESVLNDNIEINTFYAGNGWELIKLDVTLDEGTLFVNVADYEISNSEILSVIPNDCTILDSEGEEIE